MNFMLPRLAQEGINAGKHAFEDFDNAVDIFRQGNGAGLPDVQAAQNTIMNEAKRQLLPEELAARKNNFDSMINLIQQRIKPEETGLMSGIGTIANTISSIPLNSVIPLIMLRLKDQTPFTNPYGSHIAS